LSSQKILALAAGPPLEGIDQSIPFAGSSHHPF